MFYKKGFLTKANKYYAQAVVKGKPVGTKQIAERLSTQCTVTRADTYAVLMDLAGVLADYMAQGKSVRLEGLGTFRYTARSQSVDTADEVKSTLIKGVRVRFVPEFTRPQGDKQVTRAIVSGNIEWILLSPEEDKTDGGGSGSGSGEGQEENPLG